MFCIAYAYRYCLKITIKNDQRFQTLGMDSERDITSYNVRLIRFKHLFIYNGIYTYIYTPREKKVLDDSPLCSDVGFR